MLTFNAAVLRAYGAPLEIERVELQTLGAGEVLVQMMAAGICHTDLEAAEGAYPAPLPIILGHEGAGIVRAAGANVESIAVGDHVVCSIVANCGHCFYCHRATPMLCEPLLARQRSGKYQNDAVRLLSDQKAVHQFLSVSSFAEYAILSENGVVAIPRSIPFDHACLLGCGVLTGVGAVRRIANVQRGESVAVVGCGPVGLNVIQGARMAGARQIFAIDFQTARLERAERMGATVLVSARDPEQVANAVRSATDGRGADHVFEAAGIVGSLQTALDCSRPGGSITILGKTNADRHIDLRFGSLLAERRLTRSSLGGGRAHEDFPTYVNDYLTGDLLLEELIDQRIELSQINEGLSAVAAGRAVRVVIQFDEAVASSKP